MISLTPYLVAFSLCQTAPAYNLDFRQGNLSGWEGSGFYLTGSAKGPEPLGISSKDADNSPRKGMIRYAFQIPPKATKLIFQAYAEVGDEFIADHRLDVVLAGKDAIPLPKQVRTSAGWSPALRLLPRLENKPRDYYWDISGFAGQVMQVVLIDHDERPNRYLFAAGFRFVTDADQNELEFSKAMLDLQKKHRLNSMKRFDSKRFSAISNAGEKFTHERLRECEIFFDQFVSHFQAKGFKIVPPNQKLMVAMFDSPEGFESYLGQKVPASLVGIYHTPTNRLVIYDLAFNRAVVATKEKAIQESKKLNNFSDRNRYLETMDRKLSDYSKEANLSTTMHEAAHQIAFNCGLLNRQGDNPCWLVEGMATYCESTDNGDWTALGTANPLRINDLHHSKGRRIPLEKLIVSDDWRNTPDVLLGYAQSWALYHWLMKEKPAQLKEFLAGSYPRKTSDYRLLDFRQAFGNDLANLEARYLQFISNLMESNPPSKAR